MIQSIEFKNFRNVKGIYNFNNILNVIIGKNNSGKSNLLDGIKLAFSAISSEYFKVVKSDFYNSDDSHPIEIIVELKPGAIPSLDYKENGVTKCGYKVLVRKTPSGRYVKEVFLSNGCNIDSDILRDDPKIPNIFSIPLMRIEEIYSNGFVTGISNFIESEERYKELKNDSKNQISQAIEEKVSKFKSFCNKFHQSFDIALTEPKITDERVYIVEEGHQEHNYKIGSGYKSIANIILNTFNNDFNIILIDEIENHLHPSLIRTLIRELKELKNAQIISTTHSAVVANELNLQEIIDIDYKNIEISEVSSDKLKIFMHPGRNELLFSENIILVEGYTEEMLLKYYLNKYNYNWSVINVAGVMFEPYIEISSFLHKKVIVISDNDISLSDDLKVSSRFDNLKKLCSTKSVKLLEVYNTLETDLYNNGFLKGFEELLMPHESHPEIYISKKNKKTEIAERLISNSVDLNEWHIIKGIINEFESN